VSAITESHTSFFNKKSLSFIAIYAFLASQLAGALILGILSEPFNTWSLSPESFALNLSRIAALVGTAIALTSVALASRAPWIESAVGQDRMIYWHRKIGPYALFLIGFHVLLVSFAKTAGTEFNTWQSLWDLVIGAKWFMAAFLGFIFMVGIGITSYHRIRTLFSYETWWVIHLYSYIGIALAFMHEITNGVMFINSELLKNWWIFYTASIFTILITYRIIVPLRLTLTDKPQVTKVTRENRDTVTVSIRTNKRKAMKAKGGQFFNLRFLAGNKWWEAHPYSMSRVPKDGVLQFTVKELGDHSSWLKSLRPGTRVSLEGPYGNFTADRLVGDKVILIAGGIGVTPLKAIVQSLPTVSHGVLLWRVSRKDDVFMLSDIEKLCQARGIDFKTVIGSRIHHQNWLQKELGHLPDISTYEVFLCASKGLIDDSKRGLKQLGIPETSIYTEEFEF
jgi:predicted ferric reductase